MNTESNRAFYAVEKLSDILKVIIPHFIAYLLITQKRKDFILWSKIVGMMDRKEHGDARHELARASHSRASHLTIEGLQKILAIKASMNLGLSNEIKAAFSEIIPIQRPLVNNTKIPDPHWFAGFVSAEGCFFINSRRSANYSTGFNVSLLFTMGQHIRDQQLMKRRRARERNARTSLPPSRLSNSFNCGIYYSSPTGEYGEFTVKKFSDITDKIIAFFNKYPLQGAKALDYADFCKIITIMNNKGHLTKTGMANIIVIIKGMNSNRTNFTGHSK